MSHKVSSKEQIRVEVVDKVKQAESQQPKIEYPEEKYYNSVEILDSGWLRCAESGELDEEDETMVDYYPPQFVNGVYAVEPDSEVRVN